MPRFIVADTGKGNEEDAGRFDLCGSFDSLEAARAERERLIECMADPRLFGGWPREVTAARLTIWQEVA